MSDRVERHIDGLTTRVMLTLVSMLVRTYNLRLVPESVERIRQAVEEALREAAIAGKLDTLHPPESERSDQSLIDTKKIFPRKPPPPPPKPKKE